MMQEIKKEENVIILDFLPNGYPSSESRRNFPVAQALGKTNLRLLELAPKKEATMQPGEEVYVGEGKREKIHHIIGKILYEKLTQTAISELEVLIKKAISEKEEQFVSFFNTAGPINIRRHFLQLIPGIGKKHLTGIINEREKEPFKSFADIKNRIKLIPSPEKLIFNRIMDELQGKDNYKLFTSQ